jgi:hypothetical protein
MNRVEDDAQTAGGQPGDRFSGDHHDVERERHERRAPLR